MHIVLAKAIPIVVQVVMEVVVDGLRTKLLEHSRTVINSGGAKRSGGHDHRSNCGDDRTPSQKIGDKKRKKY